MSVHGEPTLALAGDDTCPRLLRRNARTWAGRTALREKKLGIWINRASRGFLNVPAYLAVFANRPSNLLASAEIQRRQQLGDLLAPFPAVEQHPGFARVVVDGAQTIPLVRLPWGRNHDLLTSRTPQGAQGGQPADIEFVRIVKHLARVQMVAGLVKRLFLAHIPGLDC